MATRVERASLGSSLTISRILTGMWQIQDMERRRGILDHEVAATAMEPYAKAGLTSFDMADHYGSAEEIAGHLRETRDFPTEFLTKWVPAPGPITKDDVRSAVQRSLDRTRSERLDLLQFHTWTYDDPTWLDCLFWLQELKEEGLIANLGLTNFNAEHLALALHSGIDIVSNQVCFSLLDRRPMGEMSQLCSEHGVRLLAYGTLAGGFLTERWLDRPEPEADQLSTAAQSKYLRFIHTAGGWTGLQRLLFAIHEVAKRYDVSMANIATRYVLDQPAVAGAIIGARLGTAQHVQENLRVFEFSLDSESRAELDVAASTLDPIRGGCGDEYRRPPYLTAAGDLSDHLSSMPTPFLTHTRTDGRQTVTTGTRWEDAAGFSRAVLMGRRILVSGTTATHRDRVIGGSDAASQMHFIIDKLEGILRSLGARLEDVVQTRVYVRHPSDWEAVSRAHGRRLGEIAPANTLILADLVGEEYLVEMEAEAHLAE